MEKDLPRICSVLGGEKTPLKEEEVFHYADEVGEDYRISNGHVHYKSYASGWPLMCDQELLEDMINHPEKIIRRPQFSEDEKATMRLLVENGLPWISRDKDQNLWAFEGKPERADEVFLAEGESGHFPDKLFSQITWENSPFDCMAYLESEAAK